jgi:predicted PurR-regulated permease PerM
MKSKGDEEQEAGDRLALAVTSRRRAERLRGSASNTRPHSVGSVFVAGGIVLGALYYIPGLATALLLVFGGLLCGIFFDATARLLRRWFPLSRGWALALGIISLTGGLVIFCAIAGPSIAEQLGALRTQIPKSLDDLSGALKRTDWGRELLLHVSASNAMDWVPSGVWNGLTGAFSAGMEIALAAFFMFIIGVYSSASPAFYIDGVLRLFPPTRRDRWREVANMLGRALRWWLMGRVITMVLMSIFTSLALWAIQVPLAFTLGLIAGLLLFIPYIGAFVSAVPALLVGLIQGPQEALWVALVYTGVHLFEGYLITPFVQDRAVAAPPVLLLSAQLFAGVLFGMLGILFATPLAVVGMVLVQKLYLRETLGEEVEISGESHGG